MHRRHPYGWSQHYEAWQIAPVNQQNNIDYITSSSVEWLIKEEHLYAVNKIDTCAHVKAILLDLKNALVPTVPNVLNTLARQLTTNSSVNRLSLTDQTSSWLRGNVANPPAVHLPTVDSLINLLRALTTRTHQLVQLDIDLPFHQSMHRSLIELFDTQTSLKHISLQMINMPRETFKAIINTLKASNKALKTLKFANITDYADEVIEWAVEAVEYFNLSCLWFVCPGTTSVTEDDNRLLRLKAAGYRVSVCPDEPIVYVYIQREKTRTYTEPIFPTVTNDEEQTNVIETLPDDIIHYILVSLDIRSLLMFKWTNKKFQLWMQDSMFWQKYYLSKASTISDEIMTAADLIYGSHLYHNMNVNFWQCLSRALNGTRLVRDIDSCGSLNQFHEQILEEILHTYPELRLMNSVLRRRSVYEKWFPSKKWFPRRLTFYPIGSSHVVYNLNIDMTRPDAVGVRFFHGEISRAEEESNATPIAVYDWFVSTSIDEVITKIKPFVEAMIVSSRSATAYVYRHIRIYKMIDCEALPDVHKSCMTSIEQTFGKYSNDLLNGLQLPFDQYEQFKDFVQQFSDHVSSVNIDHVTPYYSDIHHHVEQMAYNKFYRINDHEDRPGYWNFEYSFLDTGAQHHVVQKSNQNIASRKNINRVKKTPHVSLICLFRKVLNVIMMPVLKSLWLRDMNDLHVPWYSFDKSSGDYDHQRTPLAHWYDYYCDKWQPLSSISVSHTNPKAWPMSAIVVGSRLAPLICDAVVSVLKDKWHGTQSDGTKSQVEALIQTIVKYDIFPKVSISIIKRALE